MWEEVYLSTIDNKERFVLSLDVSEISPLNVDYIFKIHALHSTCFIFLKILRLMGEMFRI
jgi:hypothetical protein